MLKPMPSLTCFLLGFTRVAPGYGIGPLHSLCVDSVAKDTGKKGHLHFVNGD